MCKIDKRKANLSVTGSRIHDSELMPTPGLLSNITALAVRFVSLILFVLIMLTSRFFERPLPARSNVTSHMGG